MNQMIQQMQGQLQFQQQMSAITVAFQAVSKCVSEAEDAAKAAIGNIH